MERHEVLDRVRQHLSCVGLGSEGVEESSAFGDIGLTSLDVMNLLLAVQREYGLSGEWIANIPFPSTINEFAAIIDRASAANSDCAR
jgi:acyl carrier protein